MNLIEPGTKVRLEVKSAKEPIVGVLVRPGPVVEGSRDLYVIEEADGHLHRDLGRVYRLSPIQEAILNPPEPPSEALIEESLAQWREATHG